MRDIAIRVENISKRYRIGQWESYQTLRDSLVKVVSFPFRGLSSLVQPPSLNGHNGETAKGGWIWALKDVSFEIQEGEVLGIIGRNGAGKSTLLKILSGITEPTEGYGEIHGRVGSLLEVGTGFHPELTGRENIYLNGAILGMKKAEIARKFDEIVAFAEVEKFIDTPVKRYSSGMHMRLAFAVAAHLEPEILLVDEVLAVGDAAFQKKCLGKMGDVAKEGRTILFVSHNLLAMEGFCQRVIWIEQGRMVEEGQPGPVISHYLQMSWSPLSEQVWNDKETAPGNDEIRLHRASIRPLGGFPADVITVRTPFIIEFEYWNLKPGAHLSLSLQLYNAQGILVFEAGPVDEPVWQGRPYPVGLFHDRCHIPGDLLNDGTYRVILSVAKDQATLVHQETDILVFEIHDSIEKRGGWFGSWNGAVRPLLAWQTELIEADGSLSAWSAAKNLRGEFS